MDQERIRGYLYTNTHGEHSDPDYMAIHCSMSSFSVDDLELYLANEVILAVKDVGHADRTYRQYKDLSEGYYFEKSRSDMLRHAMKHIIVPHSYRAHTTQDSKILNGPKIKRNKEYLPNAVREFRKADGLALIPEFMSADISLFRNVFSYDAANFESKVTEVNSKELQILFK